MNMILRSTRKRIRTVLLLLMIFMGSCGEIIDSDDYDITGLDATPSMALPLAYGSLSIQDFLNNEDSANIKIDDKDVVYYLYEKTLISQGIKDMFILPNLNVPKTTVSLGGPAPTSAEIVYATKSLPLDFNLNPEKLNEIFFKQGSINLSIAYSSPNPNVEVEISLPDFKLNNVAFTKRVTNANINFPLTGYIATLINNTFTVKFSVIVKQHSGITTVPKVDATLSFTNMDFKSIRGFFGDQQVVPDLPDQTLTLNVFNTSFKDRDVSNAQSLIYFKITNDYGVPVTLNFIKAQGQQKDSLAIMNLDQNPVTLVKPGALGESAITNVNVTNAQDVINSRPTELYYKLDARINKGIPPGSPGVNFCADTSKIRVKLHVEIPLFGRASKIILADTVDLDLSDLESSEVESFFLNVKTTNQLPVDATLQFYLTDDKAVILDSLFDPAQKEIIQSSKVNSEGELQSMVTSQQKIDVPKNKIDKIFKAKKLIINAKLNTVKSSNNIQPNVQFKSKYKMNVNIGLNAKLKLKVDL